MAKKKGEKPKGHTGPKIYLKDPIILAPKPGEKIEEVIKSN